MKTTSLLTIMASAATALAQGNPTSAPSPAPAPAAQPSQLAGDESMAPKTAADRASMAIAQRMAWAEIVERNVDPRVVTDPALAAAIRETGFPWRVRDRKTGIEMLLVPPGQFNMGMSVGDALANGDERPVHEVVLTKPFYLGRTEVTQAEWSRIMGSNPSYFQDVNFRPMSDTERAARLDEMVSAGFTRQQAEMRLGRENLGAISTATWPVETLTWEDVQLFVDKSGLRVPTEAEWEFACRAGTSGATYGPIDKIGWTNANAEERSHPVGAKSPNALGLYDMLGNVWEWTSDWYSADYYKACELGATDPKGPGPGNFRVLRGGSWDFDDRSCRSSFRLNYFLGDPRITDFGIRVARTP